MLKACRVLKRMVLRMEDGYDSEIKTGVKEHPKQETGIQANVGKGKVSESAIDELIRGMKDLQLKFTMLEKGESSSIE